MANAPKSNVKVVFGAMTIGKPGQFPILVSISFLRTDTDFQELR
jgi:hypothetical protein